jgi:NADPH:quinone reductase-like Zn-dependent oxidoreductase
LKFINYKDSELFIDEKPISDPLNNQVQIEIYSSSVNRADLLQKKGHYPPPKGESEILGLECAGIISKTGNTSKRFKVGDKVCAILGGGGYAEFVNVDERQVMPLPSKVSLLEGGALSETTLTVYENIFNLSQFKKGEVVLIHGGSSGIGTAAISILKNYTDQIFVTAGSDEKCKACINLGASDAINYKEKDFLEYFENFKFSGSHNLHSGTGKY